MSSTEIIQKTLTLRSGDESIQAYLAHPPLPKGGMLLIHEWWGLNDWVKQQADRFAQNGLMALAVDLYRGQVAQDPAVAHELSRGLPEDRALRDLQAGVLTLSRHPLLRGRRFGVIGWCMGGGYALSLALREARLSACVIYYGRLLTDEALLKKLSCPVLGIFGDRDRGIPVESVRAFERTLQRLGKQVEIHIFENAGHAFANPNNRQGYNPQAERRAWELTLDFLKRTLKF